MRRPVIGDLRTDEGKTRAIRELEQSLMSVSEGGSTSTGSVLVVTEDAVLPATVPLCVLVDISADAVVTLPPTTGLACQPMTIKLISAGSTVTIETTGGQLIDGAATVAISTQWESLSLLPLNGAWYII